jgi:hypothetical protein
MEILDAYTIRKTLPRLLVAAIGITISWPVMSFMLQVSDDLGFGVRHLIYAPFSALGGGIDLTFGGNVGTTFFTVASGSLAAVPVWIAFGGLGALLSFAATGALAVIVAILVLILRQIAIILLILIAPLAIAAYILPNTSRFYKVWWESFSRALLMFPMIAAFIAIGRVFSAVSFANGHGDPISQFIGFVAYFAPYFLIPLTFKMSGGVMRGLGGFVSERSQGGFNALRGYRSNQTKKRVTQARTGGLYDPKRRLGKALNTIGSYTLDADEQLVADLGTGTGVGRLTGRAGTALFGRGGRKLHGEISDQKLEHNAKLAQKLGNDYRQGWAMSGRLEHFAGKQKQDENGNWVWDDEGQSAEVVAQRNAVRQQLLKDNTFASVGDKGRVTWQAATTSGQLADLSDRLGVDGASKDSHTASELIKSNFSTLESAFESEDTKRASIKDTGLLMAASKGKLDGYEMADELTTSAGSGAPLAEQFALKRQALMENLSKNDRPELRSGHAVKLSRQDGKLSARAVLADPGSIEAQAAVNGITGSQLSSARAETVRDAANTLLIQAGGPGVAFESRSPEQRTRIMEVYTGYTNPYNSPEQKNEFGKIMKQLALPTGYNRPDMGSQGPSQRLRPPEPPAAPEQPGPEAPAA